MSLMRYVTPTLDNMFMESLAWVDKTYQQKHKDDDPGSLREMYYPNLRMYATRDGSTHSKSTAEAITMMLMRLSKKAGISLAIFGLSYLPVVGRFVLPAASFYTFNKAVGLGPAGIIFGTGIFLPRRYLIIFLQSYFTSRSLMRELVCSSPLESLVAVPITKCLWYILLLTCHNISSNPTSLASSLRKSRKSNGSMIAKDYCLDLPLGFISSWESRSWGFSFMELQRHRRHTSSPRLQILPHRLHVVQDLPLVNKHGRTSMSFWAWICQTSTLIISLVIVPQTRTQQVQAKQARFRRPFHQIRLRRIQNLETDRMCRIIDYCHKLLSY